MQTQWKSRVTFSNEMEGMQKKVEVKALGSQMEDVLIEMGLPFVHIPGIGSSAPAIVGMRASVKEIIFGEGQVVHVLWDVAFWPTHPNLIQRLFAQSGSARYEIPAYLRTALSKITYMLQPKHVGASIEFYFAMVPGMNEPFSYWRLNQFEKLYRDQRLVEVHNQRIYTKYWFMPEGLVPWALNALRRRFPNTPALKHSIRIPDDEWETIDEEAWMKLTSVWIFPALYSLWKAVYASGKIGLKLQQEHNYVFNLADQTFHGRTDVGMREVFSRYRGKLNNLTMFG